MVLCQCRGKELSANNLKARRIRCLKSFVLKNKKESASRVARIPCALEKNIFAHPSTKLQSLKWKIGATAEQLLLLH